MTKDEIMEFINTGSGQRIESIKEAPAGEEGAKELAKLMIAFANTNDGTILVGADESTKNIVGLALNTNFTKEIADIGKKYCDPPVTLEVLVENMGTGQLGVINVIKGNDRPYSVDGDVYIRRDKKIYIASHNEIQDMYKKRISLKGQKGDRWPVEGASYEDLDPKKVENYIRKVNEKYAAEAGLEGGKEKFLKDLGVLTESGGVLVPTAGGLLIFGEHPQKFLISSGVRIARFKGKDTGSFIIDQREITGTIPEMIDETEQFIVKNMQMASTIEGFKRDDFAEYPLVAVRETVTNAIVHRDYAIDNSQVRIFIFDDRIEVYTPGGLCDGVTIDNIDHAQYSRNIVIVSVLMRIGQYIEKLGTGIRRMKEAVKQNGLKEPKFFDTGIDFIVTLFGPADKEWHIKKQERIARIQQTIDSGLPFQAAERPVTTGEEESPAGLIRPDAHMHGRRRSKSQQKKITMLAIIVVSVLVVFASAIGMINSYRAGNSPVIQYRKASELHRDRDYYRAISAYKRFLKKFPDDKKAADAQYYIAACFEELNDSAKALDAYNELIKKYPSSQWAAYALYWKAGIHARSEQLDGAIEEYEKILQDYPEHSLAASSLYELALCHQKQGKLKEAIDEYERSLDSKRLLTDDRVYYQMALCYSRLKQPEKAKEMFQKLLFSENADPELIKETKIKMKELNTGEK